MYSIRRRMGPVTDNQYVVHWVVRMWANARISSFVDIAQNDRPRICYARLLLSPPVLLTTCNLAHSLPFLFFGIQSKHLDNVKINRNFPHNLSVYIFFFPRSVALAFSLSVCLLNNFIHHLHQMNHQLRRVQPSPDQQNTIQPMAIRPLAQVAVD